MNQLVRIAPLGFEIVKGNHYVLTEADVFDGKNRLGMDVSHLPLNVPLCEGCDGAIHSDGICHDCGIIHSDIADAKLIPLELHKSMKGGWVL
jgi:hypothetical protein